MPDYGSRVADKAIASVQRQIHSVYTQAAKDVRAKLSEFTSKHLAKDKLMREKLEKGLITQDQYASWMRGQLFMEKQWKDKLDQCNKIMLHANEEAARIVQGKRLDVFAENYNHQAFELEKKIGGSVGFNTYNAESVERLLTKNPDILPKYRINQKKDYVWNGKKARNSVTQGIIQGESIDEITKRLTSDLCTLNENKMRTFARTSVTGAQNAGRLEQMHDAEEMGIKVKKRWLATLDSRTRDTHQELDGQEVAVDEPFVVDGMEIMFPGDPNAEPELVYNCRCTMIEVYEGIDRKSVRRDEDDNMVENMTYKEWKAEKENTTLTSGKKVTVEDVSNKVEYGELFSEEQKQETERTLVTLGEDYPLEKPLDFVGDARLIHPDIPEDYDHLDISADPDLEKKYGGITAHYYHHTDGSMGIEVFSDNLETHSLKEDFDMRHELRMKFADKDGMLSEENAISTVSGTVEGTIRHEYCHALQDQYLSIYGGERSADEQAFVDDLFAYFYDNRQNVMQISQYAASHPFEMLSESFVQIQDTAHPDTVASRTAREVWGMFEAFVEKKGGKIR